ncbi:MAG: hypothetical protein ACFE9I_01275 [Candidatus Hermodarchaeota archaeon]
MQFSIFIVIIRDYDKFLFSAIILISIQICMRFNPRMPSEYYCPRCQSDNIIEYDDYIECQECGRIFFKEDLDSDIEDEDILSEDELEGFMDAFEELKDKNTRKEFFRSLEKDFDE